MIERRSLVKSVVFACLVALGAASMIASPAPQTARAKVREYVRSQMGFTPTDWNALLRGRAVGRIIETDQGQDVNIFGAVRIAAPPARMLEHIHNIDRLERTLGAAQVARFSDPPKIEDLASFTLTQDDFEDLPSCRVGSCDLQLPANTLQRVRGEADWRRPGATGRVDGILRQMMFDRLRAYRTGGMPALEPYADRDPATPVASEFLRIIVATDVPFPVPALVDYVKRYPQPLPKGAEDMFYWNTGEFGVKPTTRVNHVTI